MGGGSGPEFEVLCTGELSRLFLALWKGPS